jgi:hypothetical protein
MPGNRRKANIMNNRVWVEFERPRDKAHAKQICALANGLLARMYGVAHVKRFTWNGQRLEYGNEEAGTTVLKNGGIWLDLDTVGQAGRAEQRAAEVAKIVAHAASKTTMSSKDDAVARPLAEMLREDGIINSDAYHLEWQGAWEHGVACFFWGDGHCLNVCADGEVEVFA